MIRVGSYIHELWLVVGRGSNCSLPRRVRFSDVLSDHGLDGEAMVVRAVGAWLTPISRNIVLILQHGQQLNHQPSQRPTEGV
jgi:hypothetical protein